MDDLDVLKTVTTDPINTKRLLVGIETAVQRSFDSDLIRDGRGRVITTQAEIKRRVRFCIDAVMLLRNEAKWSIPRIADTLPKMLRRFLDGLDWDPTKDAARLSWFAEG